MSRYKVYEIKFKDGMIYYGYTAKPFKMRMAEHIEKSQKGKNKLYKKMRNAEYDCDARVVQHFPNYGRSIRLGKRINKKNT